MKYVLVALFAIAGLVLAAFVGIRVFFVGGVVNMVQGAEASPTNAGQIAWGAAEVFILAEASALLIIGIFWAIAGAIGLREPKMRRSQSRWP